MKFDISMPVYLQVINRLKMKIINGEIKAGEKLPSGRELSNTYTINPNTCARVYKEMENMNLCFTKRGVGTFVTEDIAFIENMKNEMAKQLVQDCLKGLMGLGFTKEETLKIIAEIGGDFNA